MANINELKNLIEEAMSEVDGIPDKKRHKNLLGDKWKYIKAIAEKIVEAEMRVEK